MANKANPHGQSKASLHSDLPASDLRRYRSLLLKRNKMIIST